MRNMYRDLLTKMEQRNSRRRLFSAVLAAALFFVLSCGVSFADSPLPQAGSASDDLLSQADSASDNLLSQADSASDDPLPSVVVSSVLPGPVSAQTVPDAPAYLLRGTLQLTEDLKQLLAEERAAQNARPKTPVAVTHTWVYPYGAQTAETYSLTYYILRADYTDCTGYTRNSIDNEDFLVYLQDDRDDRLITELVECFDLLAEEHGLNSYEEVELIISFVQSFSYVTDEEWKGADVEYPKFPLETLYDRCGDCEDMVLLLEALLLEKGYGCCMLVFEDHAALGLYGTEDLPGWYFSRYGQRYYYVETTGEGWRIGEVPDERRYSSARMIFPD